MKDCSRRHRAMGPRNVFLNHLELRGVKQMLVSRIRKHRKGRLFVCELCAKGVCHANTTLPVCLDQRMVQPTLVKKFVNDDSLVNDVDAKSIHGYVVAVVFEIVWIGDERRISFVYEIFL